MRNFVLTQIFRIAGCSIFLGVPTGFAQENSLESLMLAHGLSEYDLARLPMEQFFDNPYVVSKRGSELVVSHALPERVHELRVGDQSYLWENRGEFGRELRLKTADGIVSVMDGNIVDLLSVGNETFVISGLAHLGMASGALHAIPDSLRPTTVTYITTLPDAPLLVYLDDDREDYPRKVLVGSQSVMSLSPDNRVDILYWDAFWAFGLPPTSIVRYEDHYLIGLPHGIAAVPAPFGPASQYCRDDSRYAAPDSCTRVRFFADETFINEH